MRWPRQIASAAGILAILTGPPAVLVYGIGWPLPARPDRQQWEQWISQPLTEDTMMAGLVLLAWALWLLTATITLHTTAVRAKATIRRLRRMPLPTPMQATATGMAGAAALWTPTTTVTIDEPAAPTTSTGDLHHPTRTAQSGIDVPGGWIPTHTADQIAAAGALVWLRRRRAYQPPPAPRDDRDLTPLPPTVTAVQATLATNPTPPDHEPAVEFPLGGIGLNGPGAADAARGILITTLLQALRPTEHPTTVLVTSRPDLTTLLGNQPLALDGLPGLHITDTPDQALTALSRPDQLPGPPTLLTHTPTDPTTAARLHTALTGTRAVLIGTWGHGTGWRVEPDGHTERGRLCVLTTTAARDLLTVLTPTPAASPPVAVPPQRPPQPPPPRPPARRPLRLRVLGDITLHADNEPVPIRRSAALQILVALAVHPEGLTARALATTIWPGLPPHTVTRRLYTTLSDLRTTITTTGQPDPITHTNDRYHLHHQHTDVDLWHLNAAITHATAALTNQDHAHQAVIDHYTGDLATGHTWPWLDPTRETLRRHLIDAHTTLAHHTPDPQARLRRLQDALRLDPYNEHLHDLAADTLTTLGDHHTANALLTRYRQRLTDAGLASARHGTSPTGFVV
ncbi:AfsR/SARP family transcriptional regulator [Micromonospora yangpuensis]|uniref:Transcriptional activator domain-containing protein n=1 Tax=Micromonospora yangpuensis TaxID=683228 RepID=A0A1C6U4L1_9ACTN|nr:BTAD domain-containing putative transcriptional regulator [Micromonospora yangpuensis]GGL92867.1 hypothetical protein GCM10012279_08150 [Micromonospora yangpuensis]SCL48863.1 transcriptional activator domain-containing protein [Micromonospora yangpuensis]